MNLKKLELSGFKSFAKTTVLEFPSAVTGVVGPNGSGKSNIKEAIQWVLGEQSMKSLRGKKGEDLIWNGSPHSASSGQTGVPRMGKASVTLIFDNRDGRIPLDFEEVSIERKIFRDGINEYFINGSQVRLKDVVELMARIGLGETKHNIIGQGEVDRILLSSSRDRRAMLEEALGLRVYQLKKRETERKLTATETNVQQVESLVREIAPHLKFLRLQAQKAEARESVEGELRQFIKVYCAREQKEIEREKNSLTARSLPIREKREALEAEIKQCIASIGEKEKELAGGDSSRSTEEKEMAVLEARRRELERELGRLEGKYEVEKERATQPKFRVVDTRYIQDAIREFVSEVRAIVDEEDQMENVRAHLYVLIEDLEHLLKQIAQGSVETKKDEAEIAFLKELEKTIHSFKEDLAKVTSEIEKRSVTRRESAEKTRGAEREIREFYSALRAKQDEERDIALQLERFKFDEERIALREAVLQRECDALLVARAELASISLDGYEDVPPEDLKRRIERLRLKLEEIGGIDPLVVKEYQETESRHAFLVKEIEDLAHAAKGLKELLKELDDHIQNDFRAGFSKIKDEFHTYFRIIFGGGKASLQLVKETPRRADDEEFGIEGEGAGESEETEALAEEGVEISVELPRKRIKGLAMLSGGERALTSIALLFAITAVNPPPFLILDETDAALDEANTQRYAAILKELAKHTQLILVTHNRETMKSAGILYGVTMGDDGVSKLLSLKFEEAEVYTNR